MAITDSAKKWLWFVGLWIAGVVAVTALAWTIRLLAKLAGL